MSSPENLTQINNCLACGSTEITLLLDLGYQPPANSFKQERDDVVESYPLAVNCCGNCYHVQLTHAVNPEILYKDYSYVSGTSTTMYKHFDWFARLSVDTMSLMGSSVPEDIKVLDIGCNDGSQLDAFKRMQPKAQTHGVDPAANIVTTISAKHKIKTGFFDYEYTEGALKDQSTSDFDIIVAQNVFAHNPDPFSFLRNATRLLNKDGLLFVQTSQSDMVKNGEFDTIYHEHISYFSIRSMHELAKRVDGLFLVDIIKSPLHGNSYIFVFSKKEGRYSPARINNAIAMEEYGGYAGKVALSSYASRCKTVINTSKYRVDEIGKNNTVVGYGAAAKAMTFLNATGITPTMILDDSPLKQGKYTARSGIPVVNPGPALAILPNSTVFLILAWNFYDEIVAKIKKTRPYSGDIFLRFYGEKKDG